MFIVSKILKFIITLICLPEEVNLGDPNLSLGVATMEWLKMSTPNKDKALDFYLEETKVRK